LLATQIVILVKPCCNHRSERNNLV